MKVVLIFVPLFAYLLLVLIFLFSDHDGYLEALLKGYLSFFAFIAMSTEVLSIVKALNFFYVLLVWLVFIVGLVIFWGRMRGWTDPRRPRISSPLEKFSVSVVFFILFATFVTAVVYPPNNWDSMTYHMARVVHWIANESVAFYPTAIVRQLYQMPLAEFAILHLQILTGTDLYANLVQWVSFVVVICLGSLVAAELKLGREEQIVSVVVIATLPMAILQSSSTQNDVVASAFVMAFALFMLRLYNKINVENLLFASIALGLALLTKGTAYLYCAAIGVLLGGRVLLRYNFNNINLLKRIAALFFVLVVASIINLGHWSRNYQLYGTPLSTETAKYSNQDLSAQALVANIIRNVALHLGTPSTKINHYVYRILQELLGKQLNNPATTWPGTSFRVLYTRHEDTAGNLLHVLIALLGVVLLPWLWPRYNLTVRWYTTAIIGGGILYCWLLKWQPWASRLHTPLFALGAPVLAIIIVSIMRLSKGGKYLGYGILVSLACYSVIFVFANKSRSLIGLDWYHKERMELYFENRPKLFRSYENAMETVLASGNQQVGLYMKGDDWEYPFWMFALLARKKVIFRHVGVRNVSRSLCKVEILPKWVIATKDIRGWGHSSQYTLVYTSSVVKVFERNAP